MTRSDVRDGAGGGDQDMGPRVLTEAAQRAVGVLAARRRADAEAAEMLLVSFPHDAARAFGFLLVGDLLLTLLEQSTGEPADRLCQELSLDIARTFTAGPGARHDR